jgi:hypothetical protein
MMPGKSAQDRNGLLVVEMMTPVRTAQGHLKKHQPDTINIDDDQKAVTTGL